MTDLEFFKSLDFDAGLDTVTAIFARFSLQYAATIGLNGRAQVRPIEFKFEQEGVLYFDTVTFYTSYKELQANPYIEICLCNQSTMTYIRLRGKVNFTKDPHVIARCFDNSPVLSSQFGDRKDVVIAYYLTEAEAELTSFTAEIPNKIYSLQNKYDASSTSACSAIA